MLFALTTVILPSRAVNRAELWLGIGVAAVACSNLFLFGLLSRRVHLAWHRGRLPWRLRIGEFIGIGAALCITATGSWCLTVFDLNSSGMIIGGLVALSMSFAALCLGNWSTLAKSAESRDVAEMGSMYPFDEILELVESGH